MAPRMSGVLALLAAIGGGALVGITAAARRSLMPGFSHQYDISPLVVTDKEIEFKSTKRTSTPGFFGLHLLGEEEPATIGPVISRTEQVVRRHLIRKPASLSTTSKCRWSGIVASTPDSPFKDVEITTSLGPAPAWLVEGESNGWAIHVHGQGSDRRQTLRGVATASALGLNSLVISYRNDGEAPGSSDGLSHLGESEWHDLDDALHFVVTRGATQCVVFGWSLGATLAMNTLQRSGLSDVITGIVMVAPVLSWEAALRSNANHQGWPRVLGTSVAFLLGLPGISRVVGLSEPLKIRKADAARLGRVLRTPILILHNKNDWSVPFEISRKFAHEQGQRVELVPFDCSGHTQEWNSDPIRWDLAVRRWYGGLLQSDTAGERPKATAGEI
jgi:uncharacterized protein